MPLPRVGQSEILLRTGAIRRLSSRAERGISPRIDLLEDPSLRSDDARPPFAHPTPAASFPPRCPPESPSWTIARWPARWRAWPPRSSSEPHGTDGLVLVGIQRRGVELAARIRAPHRPVRRPSRSRWASSTSRSTGTISRRSGPGPWSARPACPISTDKTVVDRGRRALHRPHGARGARRVRRLRPPAPDPALRADRPRRPRAADPGRHRRAQRSTAGPGDRVDVLVSRARRPRRGRAGAGRHERHRARQGPGRPRAAQRASRSGSSSTPPSRSRK